MATNKIRAGRAGQRLGVLPLFAGLCYNRRGSVGHTLAEIVPESRPNHETFLIAVSSYKIPTCASALTTAPRQAKEGIPQKAQPLLTGPDDAVCPCYTDNSKAGRQTGIRNTNSMPVVTTTLMNALRLPAEQADRPFPLGVGQSAFADRVSEEVNPISMFSFSRRIVALALFCMAFALLVAPVRAQRTPARAQRANKANTPALPPANYGRTPQRRLPSVGDARFLPKDVTLRSTKGVPGFGSQTRALIGGANGANIADKIINVTNTAVPDDRTPFWAQDDSQLFYYVSNQDLKAQGPPAVLASGRYKILRTAAAAATTPTSLVDPADPYDYLYPTVYANGNQIAFIRSSDGLSIDDPNKVWSLYISNLPVTGSFIDQAPGGTNNLVNLTPGNLSFPLNGTNVPFANVGRPTFLSAFEVVFSGQLKGDTNYHLFQINTLSRRIIQLTGGNADERNPAASPDTRNVAFDSNATPQLGPGATEIYTPGTPRLNNVPGNVPTSAASVNPSGNRNVFVIRLVASGTLPAFSATQISSRAASSGDTDNVQPGWSSSRQNSFSNNNSSNFYLAWASTRQPNVNAAPAATHDIYYTLVSADAGVSIFPESVAGATQLDTGDPGLVFDDLYPTFAPFLGGVFRIGFQSNRTGVYQINNFPTGNGFVQSASHDLFIATVIDINAPTLIRFDTNSTTGEIVHINLVRNNNNPFDGSLGSSIRTRDDGLTPGSTVHIAVRVDDRESGLLPNRAVFVQLKNPNSKYQAAAQGSTSAREHKEYYAGVAYTLTQNNDAGNPVGLAYTDANGNNDFGTEYEAEAIGLSNNYTTVSGVTFNKGTTNGTYFQHPNGVTGTRPVLYEAGSADATAFAGSANPPLIEGSGSLNAGESVWLELKPLYRRDPATGKPLLDGNNNPIPETPSDNQGGVLYGATLTVPNEASDWYMDVILYDNAVNPFNPSQTSNFIIYDNVWGFSTALPIAGNAVDILVVSDYTLGQKFFTSRFNVDPLGDTLSNNLLPLQWGAESYYTDVDVAKFTALEGRPAPSTPNRTPTAQQYDGFGPFVVAPVSFPNVFGNPGNGIPNTLGVKAYSDELLSPFSTTVDGKVLADVNRYSIWRVLSRGRVPLNVLQSYLPQNAGRPADSRTGPNGSPYETPGTTVPVANALRMVVWTNPFTGSLFTGSGTLSDSQTQSDLTSFVGQGGRLFIAGQDIGFALKGGGATGNTFFDTVIQASLTSDDAGAFQLSADNAGPLSSRINTDAWTRANHAYGKFNGTNAYVYTPPGAELLTEAAPTTITGTNSRGDGAFTAHAIRQGGIPPGTFTTGANDVVRPAPTSAGSAYSVLDYTGAGPAAMTVSTYGQGITVYSAFGFESLSNDWFTYPLQNATPAVNIVTTLGRRAELMHNITSALRTGTITGRVIDQNGNAVGGVLVRAVASIAAEPNKAAGTALTDSNGNYVIVGLQPDLYVVFAYRPGFYTQHSASPVLMDGGSRAQTNVVLKGAGPGSLSGAPISTTGAPTSNQGGVYAADGVTPLAGVQVQARIQNADGSFTTYFAVSSDGVTANVSTGTVLPKGAYVFPSLLVAGQNGGGYTIIANPADVYDNTGRNLIANPAFLPQFNTVVVSNTPSSSFSAPGVQINTDGTIAIFEGKNSTINFFLTIAPQTVTGQVIDQDSGLPIAGATVTARLQGGTTDIASAITDANGNYTLVLISPATGQNPNLLPAGTYTVTAVAAGYSPTSPPSTAPTVTVTVGGFSNVKVTAPQIKLKLLPPGGVYGLVQFSPNGGGSFTTSSTAGTMIDLYLVTTINGVQQVATTPAYTTTVFATPQTGPDGQPFNYQIPTNGSLGVAPGTYVAILRTPSGSSLTASPTQVAGVVVVTGQKTRIAPFTLQPPKIYGQGIQLVSIPQDFAGADPRQIFGLKNPTLDPTADNNGDGIPGTSADQTVYNVFNVADWTGTDYNVSPNIALRVGKGYFVRFGAIAAINPVVAGNPVTASTFTVNLTSGWNLIGHPFANQTNPSSTAADIDISSPNVRYSYTSGAGVIRTNVSLDQAVNDQAVQRVLYYYTGSLNGASYVQTSLIQPYLGYWIRAYVPVQVTFGYPGASGRSVKIPVRSANGQFKTLTRSQNDFPATRAITSLGLTDWRLQIGAQQGELVDTDNTVGVSSRAKDGFDNRYDNEKPPMLANADGVYVTLKGTGASGRAVALADSIKPAGSGTKVWEMSVETSTTSNAPVSVIWPNINRLPRGVEPVLVDVANGKRVPMRSAASSYQFLPNGRAKHDFRIEVAEPSSLPLDIVNLRVGAAAGTRAQGGGGYRFSFTATRAADADAEVQTLSGKTVRRLQTRAQSVTETAIIWDGRDLAGGRIPAGPYALSLSVRDDNGNIVRRRVMFMHLQ